VSGTVSVLVVSGRMVKQPTRNRGKGPRRARRNPRKNIQKQNQNAPRRATGRIQSGSPLGAVVRTIMPRIGFSDLRSHRISWILGYTFVGDGTRGAANAVLFLTNMGTYITGNGAGPAAQGAVPILSSDTQLGATYCSDIEKHYSRKVIKRMWVHVASLQPATSNNMMAVVAVSRGPGLAQQGVQAVQATSVNAQGFTNVMSMNNAMTVDSFETKSMDVTQFIAGGSGAKQNEFELAQAGVATTVIQAGQTAIVDELEGLAPASLIVSGNSTTAGLQNTKVHAIIIEQEIDLLDFVGGSPIIAPIGVSTPDALYGDDDDVAAARARDVLRRIAMRRAPMPIGS